MRKTAACLFLIAALTACTMPETRIYSLTTVLDHNPPATVSNVAVAVAVSSPRYLAQPYIAYRTSPNQLTIARYAKWDSPPDEMVGDAFRDALSSTPFKVLRTAGTPPDGSYPLQIVLKHFERLDEGDISFAEIACDVSLLSPAGELLYRNSFVRKRQLADRSFLSLAKGLSSALEDVASEVREAVTKKIAL